MPTFIDELRARLDLAPPGPKRSGPLAYFITCKRLTEILKEAGLTGKWDQVRARDWLRTEGALDHGIVDGRAVIHRRSVDRKQTAVWVGVKERTAAGTPDAPLRERPASVDVEYYESRARDLPPMIDARQLEANELRARATARENAHPWTPGFAAPQGPAAEQARAKAWNEKLRAELEADDLRKAAREIDAEIETLTREINKAREFLARPVVRRVYDDGTKARERAIVQAKEYAERVAARRARAEANRAHREGAPVRKAARVAARIARRQALAADLAEARRLYEIVKADIKSRALSTEERDRATDENLADFRAAVKFVRELHRNLGRRRPAPAPTSEP